MTFRNFIILLVYISASYVASADYKLYKVKNNDTLYSIARKFKVTLNDIVSVNRKNVEKNLQSGEKLKIPVGTPAPSFNYPTITKSKIVRNFSPSPLNPYKGILLQNKNSTAFASGKGTVLSVNYLDGYEKYIIIRHQDGYSTVYANMEKIYVKEGQAVDKKEKLGKYNPGKGLYFQINKNQEPVNPIGYIK